MDDSRSVSLHLTADASIQAWLEEETPSLVIRCRENQTSVYVVTGTAAQPEYGLFNEHTVRIRLDDGKAFTQEWSASTDSDALFAPRPIALARQMARSNRMIFEFTPFNASRAQVHFTLTGLDQKLPQVAETCGWGG